MKDFEGYRAANEKADRKPSVVYVGALNEGSTAQHRWDALRSLLPAHRHIGLDTAAHFQRRAFESGAFRLLGRVTSRLVREIGGSPVGRRIRRFAGVPSCKLLWLDKTIFLEPESLRRVRQENPEITIVFYTPDDMANPGNRTARFLASLPLYDLVVTTKTYQVHELTQWGARRVVQVDNAYQPSVHKPVVLNETEKEHFTCDVGFVGGWEKERADALEMLAKRGFAVKVWSWDREWRSVVKAGVTWVPRFLVGREYACSIAGSRISLGFLRKANRDLQTTRSIEIPACGGFLLAERTSEHSRLFEEGKEAEFFGDLEELAAKAAEYRRDELKRELIAQAGLARCRTGGYSNRERLSGVIGLIELRTADTS